jgi:succinate-semialdehyde dehydrogenase / glutarate-semialdehyde dehydrogenase
MYSDVSLFICGDWTKAAGGRTIPVVNPATGEDISTVAHADKSDLDRALEAADKGFRAWRKVSAFDRSKVMRKAANLLRDRADAIAPLLTLEQGKTLPRPVARPWPAPTSSTGLPRRHAVPMGG